MTGPVPTRTRLRALALLAFGSLGFAAAWILLAAALGRPCSWMAIPAALDAALLLRFARYPRGAARAVLAVVATIMVVALACWGIAAARIGAPLGLMPWESALRLGAEFGWLLVRLDNGAVDLAWFGAGLVVAALAAR